MGTAEIRKITSLCKSEFVNKAYIGKRARGAVRVIRGTELPIGCAGRGATGDTVTAGGPCPSHCIAHRNVDCARVERKRPTRRHRHIENRAGSRSHAAHGRPAVLIKNPQRRCAFAVWRACAFFAGFSPHQNSKRKDSCDPKNQPCCIRYFHTVGSLLRASATSFLCRIAAGALRFNSRDIAQTRAKKASRIFNREVEFGREKVTELLPNVVRSIFPNRDRIG